jgi:hypothetical protein
MKQKTESKLVTLARLVAVYNDVMQDKANVRIDVLYGCKVRLSSNIIDSKCIGITYTGDVSGAISTVAVALCGVLNLPYVHLNIMF